MASVTGIPHRLRSAGLSHNQAWRNAFYIPGAIVLVVAAALYAYSDECPQGTLRDAIRAGTRQRQTMRKSARDGLKNLNSWILFAQYAACFGVELHVNNAMAMYFYDEYGLSIGTAGLVASLFGWMNLFARGLGGYCSDLANTNCGMRGRLAVHAVSLLAEGLVLVVFSYVEGVAMAIFTLVVFSIFTQAAEGTTFAIVPFVAPKALGSVAGVVGAGGNVGAVVWGLMFMFGSSGPAGYRHLGGIIIVSAFLTLGINIRGAGSIFRNDMDSTIERRARGDDDDESFHTASALTPSSLASV